MGRGMARAMGERERWPCWGTIGWAAKEEMQRLIGKLVQPQRRIKVFWKGCIHHNTCQGHGFGNGEKKTFGDKRV